MFKCSVLHASRSMFNSTWVRHSAQKGKIFHSTHQNKWIEWEFQRSSSYCKLSSTVVNIYNCTWITRCTLLHVRENAPHVLCILSLDWNSSRINIHFAGRSIHLQNISPSTMNGNAIGRAINIPFEITLKWITLVVDDFRFLLLVEYTECFA